MVPTTFMKIPGFLVCRAMVSGAMSFLSSEVSAITICVITLGQVHRSPLSFQHTEVQRQSAVVVCVLVWLVGIVLSVVPLLVPIGDFTARPASASLCQLPGGSSADRPTPLES